MSINRMYYGTKKIYSFLENGNQGGECNCEQEYQNGYNQGYQDGLANCTGGADEECTLGTGAITLTMADAGRYELFASDDGYDGWSKFIVELEADYNAKVWDAQYIVDDAKNGGTSFIDSKCLIKGQITSIKEINTQYGNATYNIGDFQVYRGKDEYGNPFDDADRLQVGDYVVVEGVVSKYNDIVQFSAGSELEAIFRCEGGGSSNPLEVLGWNVEETESVMQYVTTIPNEYERYTNFKWDEDGSAISMFGIDNNHTPLVFAPFVYLSNQTNLRGFFHNQKNLVGIPMMDTSNVMDFSETFFACNSLKKLPNWDFGNGRNFYSCFRECGFDELIFDAPLANNYNQLCAFSHIPTIILDGTSCEDVSEFFGWYGDQMPSVNHLVVKNLKCNWDDDNGFAVCPNITYESIIEQINSLYDFRGNGDNDTTRTLKINTNTMAMLSDEDKQIAINKGWMLTE